MTATPTPKQKSWRLFAGVILVGLIAAGTASAQAQWLKVKKPPLTEADLGISGMAFWKQEDDRVYFIVAHDWKSERGRHYGILVVSNKASSIKDPEYIPLTSPECKPAPHIQARYRCDLEAITAIPNDDPSDFMALASNGTLYHIGIASASNRSDKASYQIVLKNKTPIAVPGIPKGADFEAFALQRVGNSLLAVWADRQCNDCDSGNVVSATLFWSRFELEGYNFLDKECLNRMQVRVDYPQESCLRPISDVKLDPTGRLFISSASDCDTPGDTEFPAAAYEIGFFNAQGIYAALPQQRRLEETTKYKIEALEFMPGRKDRLVFGSDDEGNGGSVLIQR